MRRYRLIPSALLGLSRVVLAELATKAASRVDQRQCVGSSADDLREWRSYRNFRPGTYSFTVQPYGPPTGQADTVQLAPGTQTYLEIQWLASREEGYPEAGWGFAPNTFGIPTMSPQLAQAYLPTLAYHPQ